MNIQEKVISIVSWVSNVPAGKIYPYSYFKDDLHLDSIDTMLLIIKLENLFNIILPNKDVEEIETVKDATDSILRILKKAPVIA